MTTRSITAIDAAMERRAYVRGISHGCMVLATALQSDPNKVMDVRRGLIQHLMNAENVTEAEIREVEPGQWEKLKEYGGWA